MPFLVEVLQKMYNEVKSAARDNLASATSVSLTTGCWTSAATESYISLSVHYIVQTANKSLELMSPVLATAYFEGHHTGLNLKTKLEDTIADLGLQHKIAGVVHDNASNTELACTLSSNMTSVHCAAHTLQVAVNHAFNKSGIAAGDRIASHFRHSVKATSVLYEQQERKSMPKQKLMVHCKTRWNSAYDMLLRLKENRWAMSAVLSDVRITKPAQAKQLELSNDQWLIIKIICPVLEPLKLATVMLSAEQYVTASVVLPVILQVSNFSYNMVDNWL
jgi:hypothetical protein